MKKLIFLVLPLVALLGCAHSPSHEECSDRNPASLKEMWQSQVMTYVDCGSTTEKAAPHLRMTFQKGHDTVVNACVNDLLATRLFADDDSKSSVTARVQAYCQFNPVLRFCVVCQRMHDSPPLEEAFRRCEKYIDPSLGETDQRIRDEVLTKRPSSN